MPALTIKLDGDNAWPELRERVARNDPSVHHTALAIEAAVLPGGMHSGKPSVALRIDLENGDVVIAETSLVLFLTAADAFKARYGDLRHE